MKVISRANAAPLLLLTFVSIVAAAGPGLEGSGSGFYGLSPTDGPFGRTNLSPQTTQVTPVFTMNLTGNGDRREDTGFQYLATLASEASVTYGAFTGRMSFDLEAKPEVVTLMSGPLQNVGHSELEAHINLTLNDSGIVTSSTLPSGTLVVMRFVVVNQTSSFVSEPQQLNMGNPYPNGNFAFLESNGHVILFDETSLASVNGAFFPQNHVTVFTFNSAVGNRIDLTVVNSLSGYGYAGYIGRQSDDSVLFYSTVQGVLDSTTQLFVEAPPGVSFIADSGHNYAADSSLTDSLGNISTRGLVGTGDDVLIGGFIISGSANKTVLLRAIGPSLAAAPFNLSGALPDPTISLFKDGTRIEFNDNWMDSTNAASISSNLQPTVASESAILVSLPPGAYTAIVSGANGSPGIGLVEVYDMDPTAPSKLANISTRGLVQTGDNVLIGGIAVQGQGSEKVVVRAIGPSLRLPPFNIANALLNPTLSLFDGNGNRFALNDDWRNDQEVELLQTGLQPTDAAESAIVLTLSPGNYTAIVSGVNGTSGVALVEVYERN